MTPGQCNRCLVLDQDPLVRWSLVRFLETRCLEARSVASGDLALALLHLWSADVLIADDNTPGMTGLELARRCRGLHPRPRIVLLTGNEASSLPTDLGQLGVMGLIEKPLVIDPLRKLLANIFKEPGGALA